LARNRASASGMPGAQLLLELDGIEANVWYSHAQVPQSWLEYHNIACVVHCGSATHWKEKGAYEEMFINTATSSTTTHIFNSLKRVFGVAWCRRGHL
jgi:hypothetical protein